MMTNILPVTFTFMSVAAISMFAITSWVGMQRSKVNTLRGDGGDPVLFKRIRIHGNLMENLPLFILVLGAAESAGLSANMCWLAVATFVVGRVFHFIFYDSKLRGGGMFLTVLPSMAMGGWILNQIWF